MNIIAKIMDNKPTAREGALLGEICRAAEKSGHKDWCQCWLCITAGLIEMNLHVMDDN